MSQESSTACLTNICYVYEGSNARILKQLLVSIKEIKEANEKLKHISYRTDIMCGIFCPPTLSIWLRDYAVDRKLMLAGIGVEPYPSLPPHDGQSGQAEKDAEDDVIRKN